MKNITKLISFILLIAFVSLLGFSLIIDNNSHDKYSNHSDCFGVNCGPVEHMVQHDYIVEQINERGVSIISNQRAFIADEMPPQLTYLSLESPPPKISLV